MENLQKIAQGFFKKNPDVEKVYVTSDGYVFLKKNAADLHAQHNPAGKKLSVKVFENEIAIPKQVLAGLSQAPSNDSEDKTGGASSEKKLSAEERIEKINEAQTPEEVEALLKGEKAKTVKEAGQKKIAELLSGKKTPEVRGDEVTVDKVDEIATSQAPRNDSEKKDEPEKTDE